MPNPNKAPKPLVNPFPPSRTFDPVRTFDWDGTHTHFDTYHEPIGPNGAVVIRFTVPDKIGTVIHVSIAPWKGDDGSGPVPEPQVRAFNASETALDFMGASHVNDNSPTYMVVAANDPDAGNHAPITRPGKTRNHIPLVAGKTMFFNIANIGQNERGDMRIAF